MRKTWRGVALAAALPLLAGTPAAAQEALGEGMTIYMQMGGNPGDGATLPRTNGARAAAAAFGVESLVEQYSGWLPEQMLNHFREAEAADPDCIVIMGHPGSGAFADLVHDPSACMGPCLCCRLSRAYEPRCGGSRRGGRSAASRSEFHRERIPAS